MTLFIFRMAMETSYRNRYSVTMLLLYHFDWVIPSNDILSVGSGSNRPSSNSRRSSENRDSSNFCLLPRSMSSLLRVAKWDSVPTEIFFYTKNFTFLHQFFPLFYIKILKFRKQFFGKNGCKKAKN